MQLQVMKNAIGMVIYDGPSNFTGESIVAIATGFKRGKNPKTGKAIQIWILNKNTHPMEALESGDDNNVCHKCKHRSFRSCYVNTAQAPSQIWKSWKAGSYVKANRHMLPAFAGKFVRLGAYGDPASLPTNIWESICQVSSGHTGYTHSWKTCDQSLKQFCMASCDTKEEAIEARKRGWKSFRVRDNEDDQLLPSEFVCPASEEAGKRLTCVECQACDGGEWNGKQGTPVIKRHGPSWKKAYFDKGMKAYKAKKKYVGING